MNILHEIEKMNGEARRALWLANKRFDDGRYEDEDFSGLSLIGAKLDKASFVRCKFALTDLTFAQGAGLVFLTCDLRGAKFIGAQLPGVHFESCKLNDADLSLGNLHSGSAQQCTFRGDHTRYAGADFSGFSFLGRNMWGAVEVRGSANFDNADLSGLVGFTEAHDVMSRVLMAIYTATKRTVYLRLAWMVRGWPRPGVCWTSMDDLLPAELHEEFHQFIVETYPHSLLSERWDYEQARKVAEEQEGEKTIQGRRGSLIIGQNGQVRVPGSEHWQPNVDVVLCEDTHGLKDITERR